MGSKLIITSLIVLFTLGLFMGFISDTFNVTPSNSYADPLADVSGFIIDLIRYAVEGITYVFQALTGLFGGNTTGEYIEINGTGFDDGKTLDGQYNLINGTGNYLKSDGLFSSTKINTKRSGGTVTEARIDSGKFGLFIKTIYNSTSVNNPNERWYKSWNKSDTSSNTADLNQNAEGNLYIRSPPQTAVENVQNFFNDTKQNVKNYTKSIGILPKEIGLPILILILVGIIVGVIKLFPWT